MASSDTEFTDIHLEANVRKRVHAVVSEGPLAALRGRTLKALNSPQMEAALKSLASTVELLAVAAQSGSVGQWEKPTLSRAFQWARYCEHLFSRFHNNSSVRGIMEKQLQLTNQNLRASFPGYTELSFSDLAQCQQLLLVALLNNPELPISILRILFDPKSPVNTRQSEYQDVTGLCDHIIQYKSACKVLSPLPDLSAFGADAEVQGLMLMERLAALLSHGDGACRTEHFLDSVLQGHEGEAGHFWLVIAAALLTATNSAAQTHAQHFLLHWLQAKQGELQHMCSLIPPELLRDLAKTHQNFGDAYCGVLKQWASDMEFSVSDGEWVQSSTSRTVSFQRLTGHFLDLFEACPSLRDDVEKEFKALKISDGDFDVRGLSVWGDLLSVLNK